MVRQTTARLTCAAAGLSVFRATLDAAQGNETELRAALLEKGMIAQACFVSPGYPDYGLNQGCGLRTDSRCAPEER